MSRLIDLKFTQKGDAFISDGVQCTNDTIGVQVDMGADGYVFLQRSINNKEYCDVSNSRQSGIGVNEFSVTGIVPGMYIRVVSNVSIKGVVLV